MSSYTKPAVSSLTNWGGFLATLPLVGKILETVGVLPPGVIDLSVSVIAGAIGGVTAIIGRFRARQPISGVFNTKELLK